MERLKNPKLIAALIVASLAATVFFQNREPAVHMKFFFVRTTEMPFAMALFFTFLMGLVTGALAFSRWQSRGKTKTSSSAPSS